MKKNECISREWKIPGLQKVLRIMKLTVFLFLLSVISVFASKSYSQNTVLNLDMKNSTVKEVLRNIEKQSEFVFMYSEKLIDVNREVSVTVKNKKISEVLDELFAGTDVSYKVKDRFVLLTTPEVTGSDLIIQQQPAVSGTVTDEANQPLPGVTVLVKGTTQGTVTNADGEYTLRDIPEDATLVFSFVGMRTQEIPVGNQTSINVEMAVDAIGLEEVVAIGYGTQKKANLTGSVATVNTKDITVAPVGNVTNTLAGRLPGLFVKQESGAPGSDAARLSIRGFGSALVIVDGVERNFNNIDPNEIESISVLKDGAAAIYGSRAGNGVILVTTKKGNISKPIFTYNGSYNIEQYTSIMEPSSSGQWAEMTREGALNSGQKSPYTEEEVALFYAGTDPDYPNTDWVKTITRPNTPMRQHNLSVRGGSEKIKYYAFLGYMNAETLLKTNGGDYTRYNFRSNMEANITDNLKLQVNFSTIVGQHRFPLRSIGRDIFADLYGAQPVYAGELPDKNKVPYPGTTPVTGTVNRDLGGYNDTDEQDIQGGMALDWNIKWVKGLKARAFFDYLQTYSNDKQFNKAFKSYIYIHSSSQYVQRTERSNTTLTHNDRRSRTINGQFSLNYDRIFADDHNVSAFALYEITDYSGDNIMASRSGFLSTQVDYLFGGSTETQLNNGSAFEMGRASYAGRINYGYKSKYLLESTLRYDASAKFPSDTRWGLFPSISLGWRLSEENLIKNSIPSLDNLKLRASYSESGYDAIGNFQYLSGYQYGLVYAIGNSAQQALYDMGLPNPNLTWETMTTYNLGLDMSLWERKLYGEFDVFYRKREGIMGNRVASLPSTFGASLPPENINSSDNRGFEAMLGTAGSKNDFRYDISGNIAYSRSKWLDFDEPEYTDPDDIRLNKRTGQWVDRTIGYISDGLFASQEEINNLPYDQDKQGNKTLRPGDIKYKDLNGDKVIDWRDQDEIGKGTFPHWMFGLNTNLVYKNIDCSMLFQGAFGYSNFLNTRGLPDALTYKWRWSPENPDVNAYVPRLGGAASNSWTTDHRIHDIAYVRLKTLSVGYTLPKVLTNKINWQSVRFYFAATNLFTLSNISEFNVDPEAPASGGSTSGFVHNMNYYPQQRTLSFGVNISL
jgi:TonB-linked SusC/RagA family outer membrane protein